MPFLLLQVHLLSSTSLLPFLVQASLVLLMCHAQSIPIPLVRQQAVWDVRAMCRVSLCCCCSSSLLFTGFLLLWGGLSGGHSPMGVREQRGETPCPDMDLPPWAPTPLGPSLLWHCVPPFSVSLVLSLALMSPLMHLLCCFSLVFHQFESHLALAMTGSGQFIASSRTGHPYSSLTPKPCSVHSVRIQVWLSKQMALSEQLWLFSWNIQNLVYWYNLLYFLGFRWLFSLLYAYNCSSF